MRWTVPTPTPNVEAIWRSPGLFFLLSAAWKARSVLSAWNLAAILLIAAISLIVMSSITPPTQQTYWRNFSNRPIEVAADEPRDLRRDVPEQPRDITPLREWSPLAILATTTLADLLTLPLVANPFSAMRTSLRWWSSDEFEDGVAHAWQNRLGRWPLIPFFPPLLLEGGECWRKAYAIIVMSMTAKALPGSPLEVIETEFFSQLLVSPLANPSRLDGCLVISPSVAAFPSLGAVSSKSQQSMLSDFRAV